MPDRVSASHPSVETVRATLERAGRTDRPKVSLPDDVDDERFPEDELVRLALGDDERHARVERGLDGGLEIRGAWATRALAREAGRGGSAPDAENRLPAWVESVGLEPGRSVLVDVVAPGFFYGLRRPGAEAVYEITERPSDSLSGIADRLGDDA